MAFLFGRKVKQNEIVFEEMNEAQDFVTYGAGSDNPYEHAVEAGRGNLKKELEKRIEEMKNGTSRNNVICDIHTHPSGVGEGEEYRKFSNGDLTSNKQFTERLNRYGITHIAGLIASDSAKGNSTISFVWYDEENERFYRIPNVFVSKYDRLGNYVEIPLIKQGQIEYIEENFNSVLNNDKDQR